MLFNSSNTGSTDLRETEVQQPNTAATLSLVKSSRAFSANNGQSDAGSTTTGSIFLPSSPPLAFCSATSISIRSFRMLSLIAIVPDSECRMPILIVSSAAAGQVAAAKRQAEAAMAPTQKARLVVGLLLIRISYPTGVRRGLPRRLPLVVHGAPWRPRAAAGKCGGTIAWRNARHARDESA